MAKRRIKKKRKTANGEDAPSPQVLEREAEQSKRFLTTLGVIFVVILVLFIVLQVAR